MSASFFVAEKVFFIFHLFGYDLYSCDTVNRFVFTHCSLYGSLMQIRVSSEISNGKIILNVDCDVYSNNSKSIRDALCFFLDEEKGHEISYVQFPQNFENITKNELYGGSLRVINEVSGC